MASRREAPSVGRPRTGDTTQRVGALGQRDSLNALRRCCCGARRRRAAAASRAARVSRRSRFRVRLWGLAWFAAGLLQLVGETFDCGLQPGYDYVPPAAVARDVLAPNEKHDFYVNLTYAPPVAEPWKHLHPVIGFTDRNNQRWRRHHSDPPYRVYSGDIESTTDRTGIRSTPRTRLPYFPRRLEAYLLGDNGHARCGPSPADSTQAS